MTQPILYQRSVNQDLYAYALASVYESGWRVYDPDYALSRDADIYEKVRRDPVINHAIQQRLHMVAGHKWIIEPRGEAPADKQAAKILTELVEEIPNFTEARYETAQAVIVGRTIQLMGGEQRPMALAGTAPMNWWIPSSLEDIDRRRTRFVPVWEGTGEDRHLNVVMELFSVERHRWEMVEHPEWFIKHIYGDEEARLGHGRGLLEAIYFYHWIKTKIIQEGLQGVERWAQGMVIAKIDGLRAGDPTRSNDTVAQRWLDLLEKTRGRHAIVSGEKDEIQVVEPTGQGHQQVKEWLDYLDAGITRLLLGSTRSTGVEGGDARAQSSTEAESRDALIQYDRNILDETITRDLIGALWRYNRPNFIQAGAAATKMPRFRTVAEVQRDPQEAAQTVKTVLDAGLKLKEDEAYQSVGFSPPAEGDRIVEGRAPSMGMGGDSPFGGGQGGTAEWPPSADEGLPQDVALRAKGLYRFGGITPAQAIRMALDLRRG